MDTAARRQKARVSNACHRCKLKKLRCHFTGQIQHKCRACEKANLGMCLPPAMLLVMIANSLQKTVSSMLRRTVYPVAQPISSLSRRRLPL
ncbi:hypothetical protein BJX65DRAFT_288702 [Aspergillus insuetus]